MVMMVVRCGVIMDYGSVRERGSKGGNNKKL